MRKSTVSSIRSSHAGSIGSQSADAHLRTKAIEKMKEFEMLHALERMAAEHARRLDAIQVDCNVMADAGRVFGDVLSQWPEMFRVLSLSLSHNSAETHPADTAVSEAATASQTVERLVRLPIDELQQSTAKL